MRPIVACSLLCLLLLQFIVTNHIRNINIVEAVTEETTTAKLIPENYGSDITSVYLYHPPIEAVTGKVLSYSSYPTFDFNLLTAGVNFVELRPPDQSVV